MSIQSDIDAFLKSFRAEGVDNHVAIATPNPGLSVAIQGNGNRVVLETGVRLNGRIFVTGDNSEVFVGRRSTAVGVRITSGGGATIRIGEGCMFSRNVEIRNTDEHPIYDLETFDILNSPKDAIIGNEVWLGEGVLVNKGAHIPDGCIIGAILSSPSRWTNREQSMWALL